MNQIAPYQSKEYKLKIVILNGPLKGRSFKILSDQILIGRSPTENDIILEGDKFCSRKHVLILKDPNSNKYIAEKISHKTKFYINKKEVKKNQTLKNKDILTVGKTQLQVKLLNKTELALVSSKTPAHLSPSPSASIKKNKKNSPLNIPRMILILVIPLILYLVLVEPSSSQKDQEQETRIKLKTEQDFENERIKTEEEQIEVATQKQKLKGPQFKNAQRAYLKGIRDYRNGLFGRAQDNFRVCKTLYPQHKLCSGYLKKSQIKYEQLAQRNLILGKNSMEKKQYKQCIASFNIVLKMMSHDKSHKLFKEAQTHLKSCKLNITSQY